VEHKELGVMAQMVIPQLKPQYLKKKEKRILQNKF
jgi:hypothetical protein